MERNVALDFLKLVLAFMVVGLHAGFLGEYSSLGLYLSANGIFRIAVPIFLIINGFYFFSVLQKNKKLAWFKRVLILYIVWMLFYSYSWLSLSELSLGGLLKVIVIGYHHLWYVSGMLGAAIILLIFHRIPSFMLILTVFTFFTIGVFIQYLGNYHYFEGNALDILFNKNHYHRNFLFFSYPFFCIGYLIHKHLIHEKVSLKMNGALCIIGVVFLLFESYVNCYQYDRDGGFDNYFSLLFVSPFIFLLFMKINISGNGKLMALYSSGIYFIHPFVLEILRLFTDFKATFLTFLTIIISILFSLSIIKINQRVKYIL